MRISDWSSDVCSSDLQHRGGAVAEQGGGDDVALGTVVGAEGEGAELDHQAEHPCRPFPGQPLGEPPAKHGRERPDKPAAGPAEAEDRGPKSVGSGTDVTATLNTRRRP